MTPDIEEVDRPSGVMCIGKIKAGNIGVGVWFLGRQEHRGESRLYLKVYDVVVDVTMPMNTYGEEVVFFDVREVGVKLSFWKL